MIIAYPNSLEILIALVYAQRAIIDTLSLGKEQIVIIPYPSRVETRM